MNKTTLLATAAIFAATVLTAMATQSTLNFSGRITSAYGPLPYGNGPVSVGDPFTVHMIWDTRWDGSPIVDDLSTYPDDFIYPYAFIQIKGFGGSIFPAQVGGGAGGSISIYNTPTYDSITFDGELTDEDQIFGFVTLISWNGKGITNDAISSNPADWSGGYFGIQDINGGGDPAQFSATGTIPDSSSSATLLGLGLSGLFFGSRISSRKTAQS